MEQKDRLELQIIDSFGGGVRYSKFEGIINNLERRYKESSAEYSKSEIADCMNEINCPECRGERLKKGKSFCNGRAELILLILLSFLYQRLLIL